MCERDEMTSVKTDAVEEKISCSILGQKSEGAARVASLTPSLPASSFTLFFHPLI